MIISSTYVVSVLLLILTIFIYSVLFKRRARKDEPPIVPYIIPFIGLFYN